MPTLQRPGVYVDETTYPSDTTYNATDAVACFVGAHTRGPTAATLVTSWTQFLALYGGFGTGAPSNLSLAVYNYFNNGGRQAWVLRITNATGLATASSIFKDSSAVNTLTIAAANPGIWGNSLFIDIVAGSSAATFTLIVRYGGTTDANIVERWVDLSMVATQPTYAPSVINSPVQGSQFITVTDLISVTAAPGNNPIVTTPGTPINIGVTGTTPVPGNDGGAVVFTDIQNALPTSGTSPLDLATGPLLVNIPGISDAGTVGVAITYCESYRGNCFLVVDPAAGSTVAAVDTYAAALAASSFAALYYPWILISDPTNSAPGAVRTVPPGAFVIGEIAMTDASRGVFKAPAGLQARLRSAVGVERKLTDTDLNNLNVSKVNAIRQIPGSGIVVMGARTLSNVQLTRYVNVRRTMIYVREELIKRTQFVVFEPNDFVLWNMAASVISQFLLSLWHSGGLKGQTAQEAFFVTCDATNNTPTTIGNGEVHIDVGVAINRPAEFVVIKIGQWSGGVSATVQA